MMHPGRGIVGILLVGILCHTVLIDLQAQGRYGQALSDSSILCLSSKNGYLYAGMDNYLRIDSLLLAGCGSAELMCSNGLVFRDTNNLSVIIPEKAGKLRLAIVCISNGDTVVNGYKYFQVRNIPEPQLTINSKPIPAYAEIQKNALLSCDSLGIFISDDLAGSSEWITITGFSVGYRYGGFYVSHRNPSNKLTAETKELILRIKPEEEISIQTNIEFQGRIRKELPIYRIRIY